MIRLDRTDVMIAGKLAGFIILLAISLVMLVAMTKNALAASIKDIAVVKGEVLTAGDLFHNLEKNADYVLGPAPQPGKDMILHARTLYRIASALDIDWRPQSTAQQVIVRRASTTIPASDIEAKLNEELRASGASGEFIAVPNSAIESISLPETEDRTFEISDLRYEPLKEYFEATIVAPSKEKPLKRIQVAGEVQKFISLPVLKTTMKNGDIISIGDLDFIDVAVKNLPKDIILDADKIAGMTPRRIVTAGKPVAFNDMQSPRMVGRGETVTLVFKDGGMVVSTKGKSMQDGVMGEMVRVTNITSSKQLAGVITGLREVTVH